MRGSERDGLVGRAGLRSVSEGNIERRRVIPAITRSEKARASEREARGEAGTAGETGRGAERYLSRLWPFLPFPLLSRSSLERG